MYVVRTTDLLKSVYAFEIMGLSQFLEQSALHAERAFHHVESAKMMSQYGVDLRSFLPHRY